MAAATAPKKPPAVKPEDAISDDEKDLNFEVFDQIPDLPQGGEAGEAESETQLTTGNLHLLEAYRRRAEEAEAQILLLQRLVEKTQEQLPDETELPWYDPDGKVVYINRAGFHCWNPVTNKMLSFRPFLGGPSSQWRTKNPKEIEWMDQLCKSGTALGLSRLTPVPDPDEQKED